VNQLDFRGLVDAAPDVIAVLDREHRYVYVNAALERATGVPAEALLGKRNDEVMAPGEALVWREALEDVLRAGRERTIECTIPTPRGPRRFASLIARLPGELACAVSRDVTDVQSNRVLDIAVRTMTIGMVIIEAPSGRALFRNEETDRLFGKHTRADRRVHEDDEVAAFDRRGRPVAIDEWPIARALGGRITVGELVELHRPGGARSTVSIHASPVRDRDGQIIAAVATYHDVTEARRAHEAAAYLAEAGALLERFDPGTSLQKIVDLAVPILADWCYVHLRTGEDAEVVAVAHPDPEKAAATLGRMKARGPLSPDTALTRVLAGGPPEIVEVDAAVLERAARDAEHLARLREHGYRSAVVAPLAGHDGVLGALTFAMAESGRRYEPADLDVLGELARRTGIALENARLLAAEREARRLAEEARDRTRRLQQLTVALSSVVEKRQVMSVMVDAARRALGAGAGFAWLLRDEATLELAACEHGGKGGRIEDFQTIPLSAPLPVCDAMRAARPMMFESIAAMVAAYPHGMQPGESPFRAWAVIPMLVSGRAVGAVSFSFERERTFREEDRELLAAMSGQASMALERARLFEELELAVERARLADRRKDEFLAMLGHELRNPLAPIATALQLMALKDDAAHKKERAVIRRQVDHLSRLIDDLLDVSRITRGKVQLDREVIEVGAVLAKAIEMASPLLEKRTQRLTIDVPREGLPVFADPTRLAQVFQNLLTNAAKYSEPGSEIDLRARGAGDRVVVEVEDRGMGIAPELLPRLFELFVQGDRALDRSQGGLGLGLTIAKSVCELHGGTIEAASDGPGRGSTFTVTLPRAERSEPAPPPRKAERAARPAAGKRVLVVDDNVDAAQSLQDFLTRLGHEAAVAHDGVAALELARSFRPDVALLDIGLPVMDGYELARRLREQRGPGELRLIAITGYGQETDRARSREAGFDHHLVKPIAFDALVPLLAAGA
jgi:PAS domain S-box-containing protein